MNEETKAFVEQSLLKHLGKIPTDYTFLGTNQGQHACLYVVHDLLTALNFYEVPEDD